MTDKINRMRVMIDWPDDKWEQSTEIEYVVGCLRMIADDIEARRVHIDNRMAPASISNRFGRMFATIQIKLEPR